MNEEQLARLSRLEELVGAHEAHVALLREYFQEVRVPDPSGAYAVTPDSSALHMYARLAKTGLVSGLGVDLAVNAERRGAFWWQIDAAEESWLVRLTSTGLQVKSVPVASGQIDWDTADLEVPFSVATPLTFSASTGILDIALTAPMKETSGSLDIDAASGSTRGTLSTTDYNLIHTATSAATASALVQRSAGSIISGQSWQNASFATNWSNRGSYQGVQYRITADNAVELRGTATKSVAISSGDRIFTLASGYRPPAQVSMAMGSANGTTPVLAIGVIEADGDVTVYGGHEDHVALTGIRFYLD